MKEWKIINRTQGRLPIKSIRKVLEGFAYTIVAEPVPEEVKYLLGEKKVFIQEVVPEPKKKAASPKIEKVEVPTAPEETEPKARKKRNSDE